MTDLNVELWQVAHGRAGDKGNRSNISVIAWDAQFYPLIAGQITVERVKEQFSSRQPTRVYRFDLPNLHAFNFVLDDVLEGGVNSSLNLDGHGKALSFHLLAISIKVPSRMANLLRKCIE